MKNVGKDQLSDKKIEICSGGGPNGAISKYFGRGLQFKLLFCQSTLTNSLKVTEQVFVGVLQHPTVF